jgi:hypothetical protein
LGRSRVLRDGWKPQKGAAGQALAPFAWLDGREGGEARR